MNNEMISGLAVLHIKERDKQELFRYANSKKQSLRNKIAKISDLYRVYFKGTAKV
ncbi:MAG: hypothetical protein PHQ52_00590 [Candidatus Omnitrophica bacterium]|nr:hypothetical protein [Candidatus Omnitrophota bacterium]